MRILVSFILSVLICTGASALPSVHTAPAPAWLYAVHPNLDKKPVQRDISDGYYYQLFEEQTSLLSNTEYTHYIKHIINGSGVQNASEVSVTFSPQFQQVIFHRITILREGAVLNQLRVSDIKVVQEETDADEFQYNGLKRAFVTLKDIRKDDKIEVSYSVVGFNPVFANKYSDESFFNSKTAICNYYKTIITTPARKLNLQFRNNAPTPAELHQGSTLVYFWENPPIKSWESRSGAPDWFSPNPTAYISEYADWQGVVSWGLTTFNNYHYPIPAGLQQKITAWRTAAKGNKDLFANLATRFVQNDIRYLGLEIGANTHRPHPPAEVYTQRFGDCKDKALLLSVILQQEGIPAYVALVSTTTRSEIVRVAPSPEVFDHAITAIQRSNGDLLFVDPTISGQRGELTSLYVPAYGFALLLRDGEKKLQPVTPGRIFDYTIIEKLDAHYSDTSRYTINSVYTGGSADEVREAFAETSMKDLEEKYRKYYAAVFDGIRQEGAITWVDDSLKNEFKVTKAYAISQLWDTSEKGKRSFDFSARLIGQSLTNPSNAPIDAPIALPYPCNIHYTLNLNLPENWDFGSGPLHIKNDSYQFDFVPDVNGSNMTLYYTLRTFKDHIPVTGVQQYKADYKKIEDLIFFQLYKNNPESDNPLSQETAPGNANSFSLPATESVRACWPAIWLTFFFSLFFSRLFVWLNRRSDETLYAPGSGYPLGGWLTLLGFCLTVGLVLNGYAFFRSNYYSYNNWTTYGSTGGKPLQYLYLGKMAIQLSFLAASGAALFWFANKRDIFPRMFVWYAGILLSGQLLLILLFHQQPIPPTFNSYRENLTHDFILIGVYAVIWVFYILRSDQVKSTFLEPYRAHI
jgi:transglutaminase-like putative cysteine protease